MEPRVMARVCGVVGVVAAGSIGVYALTQSREDAPEPTASKEQVYSAGMSLAEISRISQGKPGTTAPPCPDEDLVTRLKENGLPVGPCDPLPEAGAPVVLPGADEFAGPDLEDPRSAVGVTVHDVLPDTTLRLPCGPGVRFVDSTTVVRRSESCVSATFVPSLGAEEVTEMICPSAPTSVHGLVLDLGRHAARLRDQLAGGAR